jgi:cytoskeletal protein CcmA (bactofilin family)
MSALWKTRNHSTSTAHAEPESEDSVSVIGSGMTVAGDCEADGALTIDGTVEGNVRAGKTAIVGKGGSVGGDLVAQDVIIGGTVKGSVWAEGVLELQEDCVVEGDVHAFGIQLDRGGRVNGSVVIEQPAKAARSRSTTGARPATDARVHASGRDQRPSAAG